MENWKIKSNTDDTGCLSPTTVVLVIMQTIIKNIFRSIAYHIVIGEWRFHNTKEWHVRGLGNATKTQLLAHNLCLKIYTKILWIILSCQGLLIFLTVSLTQKWEIAVTYKILKIFLCVTSFTCFQFSMLLLINVTEKT